MIYLIEETFYNKETGEVTDLLKIGYTSDTSRDKRFGQYKLHCPIFKILYEIPGYTEDDEKRIQYHFRDHKYSGYGNEWFKFSQDIIDFFENIGDQDISVMPKSPRSEGKNYRRIQKLVRAVVKDISEIPSESRAEVVNRIITDLGSNLCTSSDVLGYIEKEYGKGSVEKYLELQKIRASEVYSSDPVINQEVTDFLLIYNSITILYDKLKCLCEYGLSDKAIEIMLSQMSDSDDVKSFYTALGPTRLKALGYSTTRIRKELGIVVFSEELLRNSIYSEFKVGDTVTLSAAKERIGNIYKSISYSATPKAKDLERFFEVKELLIPVEIDGTKKRVKGYELLKKKPQK